MILGSMAGRLSRLPYLTIKITPSERKHNFDDINTDVSLYYNFLCLALSLMTLLGK